MRRTKLMFNLGVVCVVILAMWFLSGCGKEKPLKYSTIHEAVAKGDLEDVKNHMQRGTAVNAKDVWGITPLFVAAMFNRVKVAQFLIKKGADINVEAGPLIERRTPLEVAASFGSKEMVELLIKKGANIERYGANALHLAVEAIEGFKEAKEKAEKGTLPEIRTPYELTSDEMFSWLANVDLVGVVKVLIKKGVKPKTETLSIVTDKGYTEIIELLRKHGVKQ